MNWFSLIPTALSAMGGISSWLNGGQTTSTTTPNLPPKVQKLADKALGKAEGIWGQKYQKYGGDRTANPTASRTALNPVMAQIGRSAMAGMQGGNGYQQRISQMMNRGPARVSAPNLVQGGPVATTTQQMPAGMTPVPARSY